MNDEVHEVLVFCKDIVDDKEELCVFDDDYLDNRIGVDEDETNMNEVCMAECTEYNQHVESLHVFQGVIFVLRTSWMKMQLIINY